MACRADLSALDLHNLTSFPGLMAAPATSSAPPQQPGQHRKLQYKGTNRISAKELPRRQRVLGPDPGVVFNLEFHSHQHPTWSPQFLGLMQSPGTSPSDLWRLLHCTQIRCCKRPALGPAPGGLSQMGEKPSSTHLREEMLPPTS